MKFKSALVTQISGSIGGMTGSRNAGGLYFRGRAMPSNPNTPGQQAIRQTFGSLTNAWHLLTQAQRDDWAVYAQNVPLPDRLGDQRNVSGQNQFVRANAPRVQAGLAIISAAPTTFNIGNTPVPAAELVVDDAGTVSVNVTVGTPGIAGNILSYVSRPQTATINYFRGPYQLIGATAFASPGSAAVTAGGASPFAQAIGQKVFLRVQCTLADGRLSADMQISGIVVATP